MKSKSDLQQEAQKLLERMEAIWEDVQFWQDKLRRASARCEKGLKELAGHQARLAVIALEIEGGCDRDGVPF